MYRVPETRVLRFEIAAWRNGSKASKETVPYCNTAVRKLNILVKNEENQHFVLENLFFRQFLQETGTPILGILIRSASLARLYGIGFFIIIRRLA